MIRGAKFIGGVAVAATLALTALSSGAMADDKDVIDYREHIMKTLDEQTAAIGQIVSGAVPDAQIVAHVEAIALAAKQAQKSFEAKVVGGEAKPEVWSNAADFNAKMKDFVVRTDKLAKDAKTGGATVVMEEMVDALTCKGCHDVYRNKK